MNSSTKPTLENSHPTSHQLLCLKMLSDGKRLEVCEMEDLRWLSIDGAIQSIMSLSEPEQPKFPHIPIMLLPVMNGHTQLNNVLELGLGGGMLARYFSFFHPNTETLVIEKSDIVISLFEQYFNPSDASLNIKQDDAFHYLEQQPTQLQDYILVDIFETDSIAPQLLESAFYLNLSTHLNTDGWLAMNTILPKVDKHVNAEGIATNCQSQDIIATHLQSAFPGATIFAFQIKNYMNMVWLVNKGEETLPDVWQQEASYTYSTKDRS